MVEGRQSRLCCGRSRSCSNRPYCRRKRRRKEFSAVKIGLFAMVSARSNVMALTKAFAANAERLGFSTLWVPEHVVLLEQYASRYPYTTDGALPAPADAPIPDPFLALCAMASETKKIRLATGICLVPEHNPLVLAKVIATLAW